MTPIAWALRPLKKYADFSGRASRAEFWWFALMLVVVVVVAVVIETMAGIDPVLSAYGPLTLAVLLATLVPSISVQARRLHDTNRSSGWLVGFYIIYGVYMLLATRNLEGISAGDRTSVMTVGAASLVLVLYSLVLIAFYVFKGTVSNNRFGANPRAGGPVFA